MLDIIVADVVGYIVVTSVVAIAVDIVFDLLMLSLSLTCLSSWSRKVSVDGAKLLP